MSGSGLSSGDHHVASAGANDLDKRAGLDAGSDGPHVGIEGADGDRHSGRQADLSGHLGGEATRFLVGGQGTRCVAPADVDQGRIELLEEAFAGQAAPLLVEHRLVAGGADAAGDGLGRKIAGEEAGDEVGQLDPGMGGFEDLRSGPFAVQYFRPEPFRAVGAAALGQVSRAVFSRRLGDLGRFGMAGVILPEPGLGGQVVREARPHRQGRASMVDRHGRRARRVDADPDEAVGSEVGQLLGRTQRAAHRLVETFDVVGRVLPRQVRVLRVEKDSRVAAGIVEEAGGDLASVGNVDHQRADAVGSVVDTEGESSLSCLGHGVQLSDLGAEDSKADASHGPLYGNGFRAARQVPRLLAEGGRSPGLPGRK